ncbi:MAG: ABC transporter permease [Paucibacter sp.]|nr:ABC transporter permease [Roseateles sp.]
MAGVLRIGFKLLVNDKGKFYALLLGITFSVFLMVQMTSMFAGVLNRAYSTVTNIGAPLWVMDPAVNTPAGPIPLPDYLLDAVRSIDGVSYAVPIYIGSAQVRLGNGTFQSASIVGLDDQTLYGRPAMLEGRIEDVFADNGFIVVKDSEYAKLGSPPIGASFEVNDHRSVVVGIAEVAANGLNGVPTLYTTYQRAISYLPTTRFTVSYVLVTPKSEAAIPHIQAEVAKLGYVARTRDGFNRLVVDFYTYQTGIGTNLLLMTVISFIVGLSISGQTFYTFILENLEKFGALKAIGAKNRQLTAMILFMATATALTGYGLGIGLVTLVISLAHARIPNYAAIPTYGNLALAFVLVLVIAAVSSYAAVRRVLRIEPFDIFRG